MENASAAFLDSVRRSMNRIRTAIGATTINPELLTCAEKLRYQGYLRRQDGHAQLRLSSATVCRSRRSSAAQDIVAIWFAKLAAAAVRICSAPVKAPWMGTCRSWTRSGQAAVATVPNSGAV
jgi:hypothetical protein